MCNKINLGLSKIFIRFAKKSIMKPTFVYLAGSIIFFQVAAYSCKKLLPKPPGEKEVLAKPVKGLTPSQLALHLEGDRQFAGIFGEAEGLGPVFNNSSCQNCHAGDGKGNPNHNLTRFGKYEQDGATWNPMFSEGGPQLQHRAVNNYQPEVLPAGVASSEFLAPNASGMGFLEAVEDQFILDMAAQQALEGIVSGVPQYIDAPDFFQPEYHHKIKNGKYIGRFGRKGSAVNLLQQTVAAYKNDMGITSDFDMEDPVNYAVSSLAADKVPDPEISSDVVKAVAFYLKTLQAPPRRSQDDEDVIAGEVIFRQIGCNKCHIETLKTGKSNITALNEVEFHPYTDLLLHDMGPELDDGYTENEARTSEWRTSPLWGLGLQFQSQGGRIFLLHDGRAVSYEEAILLHGGEADLCRTQYKTLGEPEKEKLTKFLNSL